MPKNQRTGTYCIKIAEERYLNRKEEKFCRAYAATLNGRQSAILAGWRPESAGEATTRLLRDPAIRDYIDRIARDTLDELKITPYYVLSRAIETLDAALEGDPIVTYDYELRKHVVVEGARRRDCKAAAQVLEMFGRHLGMFKHDMSPTQIQVLVNTPGRLPTPVLPPVDEIPVVAGAEEPDARLIEGMRAEAEAGAGK